MNFSARSEKRLTLSIPLSLDTDRHWDSSKHKDGQALNSSKYTHRQALHFAIDIQAMKFLHKYTDRQVFWNPSSYTDWQVFWNPSTDRQAMRFLYRLNIFLKLLFCREFLSDAILQEIEDSSFGDTFDFTWKWCKPYIALQIIFLILIIIIRHLITRFRKLPKY